MEHLPGIGEPEQPGSPPPTTEQLLLQQSILALKTTINEAVVAGRKRGETVSVQDGESRHFEVPADGTEVVISYYQDGNSAYADELAAKYGFDTAYTTVEAYIDLYAEYEGPNIAYGVYLLSDGQAIGRAVMSANPIAALLKPAGAEARELAGRIGLQEQWIKFEQNAHYRNIKRPVSAAAKGYTEPALFNLTAAQIDAVNGYIAQSTGSE